MKITLSKSQWESVGKNAGWMKKAQQAPAQQAPAQQAQGQAPASSKSFQIIDQNLKSLEMESKQLPLNGQQIRVLINQIRQLAQTDPSIA